MVGTVQVRWCPRCRTWGKARRVLIDPSQAFVPGSGPVSVSFDYVREDHRCESCAGNFTTTRITSCKPEHVWSARSVLAKLYTPGHRRGRDHAIPSAWHGHPELADFSAAISNQPAFGT